jgi:hypothetical protein
MVLLLAFAKLSYGQIVNVEGKRSAASEEGWHGNTDFNFNLTQNTNFVLDYGVKANVQYLKDRHRLLFLADLSRIQAGGENFVNSGYQHTRYNLEIGKERRFAIEAFNQVQFNRVQKIAYRQLSGVGLRARVIQNDTIKCWIGTLPMFEYEQLTDDVVERNFRQSSYVFLSLAYKLFEFQTIVYYQPRWDDFSDYRMSTSTSLEFGMLKWLRWVSTVNLTYDARAPKDVPSLVYTIRNGLRLEF